jgi:hypothetical protein
MLISFDGLKISFKRNKLIIKIIQDIWIYCKYLLSFSVLKEPHLYMYSSAKYPAPAKNLRIVAIAALLIIWAIPGYGQFEQAVLLDAGSSTVSDGAFVRPAAITSYRYDRFFAVAGLQWTFSSAERKVLSGTFIQGGSDFKIKEVPLSAGLFLSRNPYSDFASETCFGAVVNHERTHLDVQFGCHMRRYGPGKSAVEQGDPVPDPALSIWEYRNFMYRGTVRLKERDAPWNLSASLTNFDHFLIQQETNPMVNIAGYCKISGAVKIHSSIWYQGAGMLNIHANHYGFYFRTGVVWQSGY